MAKSKRKAKSRRKAGSRRRRVRLHDWRASGWNPREISRESLAGLAASLRTFGDLSGFVLNGRTGTVICGHQRRAALEDVDLRRLDLGPPRRVELGREGRRFVSLEREGWVESRSGARFRVREVSWPKTFEKAANVAANSPLLQGEFTDALPEVLEEVRAAEPELFDDLLFGELLLDYLAGAATERPRELKVPPPPPMTWVLIGIPTVRFSEIAGDVERVAGMNEVLCEVTATNDDVHEELLEN